MATLWPSPRLPWFCFPGTQRGIGISIVDGLAEEQRDVADLAPSSGTNRIQWRYNGISWDGHLEGSLKVSLKHQSLSLVPFFSSQGACKGPLSLEKSRSKSTRDIVRRSV